MAKRIHEYWVLKMKQGRWRKEGMKEWRNEKLNTLHSTIRRLNPVVSGFRPSGTVVCLAALHLSQLPGPAAPHSFDPSWSNRQWSPPARCSVRPRAKPQCHLAVASGCPELSVCTGVATLGLSRLVACRCWVSVWGHWQSTSLTSLCPLRKKSTPPLPQTWPVAS